VGRDAGLGVWRVAMCSSKPQVNRLKTDNVIEGEAYLEHTGPHANGLLSVLQGLLMLRSLRFSRPVQEEARDLHTTENKNWVFTVTGREDRGSV
jgi:hypothetical protein